MSSSYTISQVRFNYYLKKKNRILEIKFRTLVLEKLSDNIDFNEFFFLGTKLGFTDTDSFMYQIPYTGCIYERLSQLDKSGKWMDFSNYPTDHPSFDRRNHLIPGIKQL